MQKLVLATANINAIYLVRNVMVKNKQKFVSFIKLKKSLTPLMTERLNYAAISIYAAIVNTAKRLV